MLWNDHKPASDNNYSLLFQDLVYLLSNKDFSLFWTKFPICWILMFHDFQCRYPLIPCSVININQNVSQHCILVLGTVKQFIFKNFICTYVMIQYWDIVVLYNHVILCCRCTPDMDVVLDIPTQQWLPI